MPGAVAAYKAIDDLLAPVLAWLDSTGRVDAVRRGGG